MLKKSLEEKGNVHNTQLLQIVYKLDNVNKMLSDNISKSIAEARTALEEKGKAQDTQLLQIVYKLDNVNKMLSDNISKSIAEARTALEEKGKAQDIQLLQIVNNLDMVKQLLSQLVQKTENLEKKSEPIERVSGDTTIIKQKIEELHSKLLGTQSKGKVGENVLSEQLSVIPENWLKRNVEFNSNIVEFAICIDNKFIPIDSKVIEAKDGKNVSNTLSRKAEEIKKYVNSEKSLGFGIMAVPDSIREEAIKACSKVGHEIIVVPYSYIPYIVLFIIANKDRILVKFNSEKILKDLPHCPNKLEDAVKKVESAKKELTTAQNRINELEQSLKECCDIIDNIIKSSKENLS